MWQRLSSSNRPLDKATKTMLKVEFLAPASAILMKHFEDDCCNEEFLKMYFCNKKKSGAGVNVTVEITGRGQALVTFKDLSGECEEFNLCECIKYCLIRISCFSNTSMDTEILLTCCSGPLQAKIVRSGNVSFLCLHHLQSPFACNLSVGVGPARLVESSRLLRAATQHAGSSCPVSLLRHFSGWVTWMWMAPLSSSSLGCLAMSTTVVSSHLMVWWSFHAAPLLQTSPGSFSGRPLGILSA